MDGDHLTMNLRQRIAQWLAPETRVVTVEDLLGPTAGWSPGALSPRAAETLAAVTAAVALIAATVGSLPLHLYRRTDSGRDRVAGHPLANLLHGAPNDWQTAMEFREQLTAHALLYGNGYAELVFNGSGKLSELRPLHPERVTVAQAESGRLVYDVVDANARRRRLTSDEVLHLRDRSDDGIVGRSRIERATRSMALASAVATAIESSFGNGLRPSGVVESAGVLSPEAWERLRKAFENQYSGASNTGKILPLDKGMTFKPLSPNLADAQAVEALGWSVEEVARLFGVPAVMLGSRGDAYSSTVALTLHFVQYTLRPWLVRWEQVINRQLVTAPDLYVEHALDGLLRADPKVRADVHHLALADGWMTVNEVRRLENLPPLPGGDVPTPRTLPGPAGALSGEQPAPSKGT
jgi:HK97 family phage portal protein